MEPATRPSEQFYSIGEVLTILKELFPDVTVSKIRFLESQGLIEPERNASGFRRFYLKDIMILKWILIQQTNHYLPLKVIKDQIRYVKAKSLQEIADLVNQAQHKVSPNPLPLFNDKNSESTASREVFIERYEKPHENRSEDLSRKSIDPSPIPPRVEKEPTGSIDPQRLTIAELAQTCNLSLKDLEELLDYDIIRIERYAGIDYLGSESVEIAKIYRGFKSLGFEARHLRILLNSAEKEAAYIKQLISPVLRQNNPSARLKALSDAEALVDLGSRLHRILVSRSVAQILS